MKSTVSEKGQVTIPKPLRDRLGIRPGQALDFEEEVGVLVARKVASANPLDALYGIVETRAGTDRVVEELRGPAKA